MPSDSAPIQAIVSRFTQCAFTVYGHHSINLLFHSCLLHPKFSLRQQPLAFLQSLLHSVVVNGKSLGRINLQGTSLGGHCLSQKLKARWT
jgi:hypothetical protein